MNRRVYRTVKDSALDGELELDGQPVTPGMFGYKRLGINVIANRVEEIGERTAILHFKEGQGVVNGGHGLKIVRELQTRACHQLSQTTLATSWTAARKFRAVFS